MEDLKNSEKWPPENIDWYYSDKYTAIAHGNCLELLPEMPKVDLVLTDPPYGESFSSSREGVYKNNQIHGDSNVLIRDAMLDNLKDKPCLIFGTWRTPVKNAKQALIWDKGEASGMGDLSIPWKPNFEMIYILGKGFIGKRSTGVLLNHSVVTWASKGRFHQNLKPVSLILELLNKCPAEWIIFDPFLGSGTTLVAAKQLNRQAIGIEIEEKYCEIASLRLQQQVLELCEVEQKNTDNRLSQEVLELCS